MKGRPPIPRAIHAIRGTLRADRMNPSEPRPAVGIPAPRRGLSKLARAEYRRLVDALDGLGVVTVADGLALELAAQALAEYRSATDLLARSGMTYSTSTAAGAALIRVRPEVALAADAWRRAAAMLQQFGLTPATRTKVSTAPDAFADLLRLGARHAP